MDFTIKVYKRQKYQKTDFKDLEIFHGECGKGEIEAKKLKAYYKEVYYKYCGPLSLVCKKCKAEVVLFFLDGLIDKLLTTALDGRKRKITLKNYRIERLIGNKRLLKKVGRVRFIITQLKHEEKSEKTIKELEEKLSKVERTEKEAKKTIKDLKEKLAEAEKTKKELKEKLVKVEQVNRELKEKLAEAEKTNEFYCPYCGSKLASESSFCPFCGAKVEDRIEEMEKVSISNK